MAAVELGSNKLDRARFRLGLTFGRHQTPDTIINAAIVRADLMRGFYTSTEGMPDPLRSILDITHNDKLTKEQKKEAISKLLGLGPSPIRRLYDMVTTAVRHPRSR